MAGSITGLRNQSSGGTILTIEAGRARDSGDSTWIEIPSGQTRSVNLTSSGLGGLDTGSPQATTLYAVYVVVTGGGAVYGIVSTSFSAPSGLGPQAKYRRVGTAYTNSSSEFVAYQQNGTGNDRTQSYLSDSADLVVVNNQSHPTFLPFDTSPPNSPVGYIASLYVVPAGGQTILKSGDVETTVTVPTTLPFAFPTGSTWGSFKTVGGSTTISVVGFSETL